MTALYLYAAAVGIVTAGLTGSIWAFITGERPHFGLLLQPSFFVPFRAAAVVTYAPLLMLYSGLRNLLAKPVAGIILVSSGIGWSFLQGVFILTQIFGLK
jgi:hypothetical protein